MLTEIASSQEAGIVLGFAGIGLLTVLGLLLGPANEEVDQ